METLPEVAHFPGARFIEFSWGDRDYFPHPQPGVLLALKAVFWSSGSVVHVVGLTTAPEVFYAAAERVELRLAPPAYARLIAYLSHSFARPPTGAAQAQPGLFANSRFYPSTRKFSFLKTCNTWVAEALHSAGLPVSPGLVVTAAQLGEQIAKLETAQSSSN
jgi:uncharacterized protein (TIGR02117 family)